MALAELEPISVSAVLSPPDITELTTGSVDGTGVFDVLMKSTKAHLQEEYTKNRISGEEYTTVYLGALTAVLQQAVAFILSHQQKEKVSAEIGYIRQQTVTELANTDDDIPLGLGFNGDINIEGLVKNQKDLVLKQIDLATSEISKTDADKALTGQKIITELANTDDSISAAANAAYGFNGTLDFEGLSTAQKNKLLAEISFTDQKTVSELAQTDDTTSAAGILGSQRGKLDAEKTLLAQKANTELAQTSDTVLTGAPYLNTSTTVTGVVDTQKDLFTAQTNGFARDAEQKLAKMMLETWSVGATMGTATANTNNKLDDASLGAVMDKVKLGIGVS